MAHRHGTAEGAQDGSGRKGRRLLIALALNLGITVAEIVGGLVSGSLALLADAAHNLSDAGSIAISYIAWRISLRRADRTHTFGYNRAETVGALINLTTLLVIGLYLLYEAGARLYNPQDIGGWTMVIVGAVAFVEDLLSVYVLSKDRGSLNVRSAFLHMIADTLATVGVIVGGVVVLVWGVRWIDPAVTALIAVYIFVHGYREIRETIGVLMDDAPPGFDFDGLVRQLKAAPGVEDVHHVHVWQAAEGRIALEAHLATSETDVAKATAMKDALKEALRDRFRIEHATLELEHIGAVRHDRELVPHE